MSDIQTPAAPSFEALGLVPRLLKTLAARNLTTPTPIQAQTIPLALEGHDVLGLAQTGTGKTLAFGLPLLQTMGESSSGRAPRSVRALVLAPTRELVNQIADNLTPFVQRTSLRVSTVVGGQSINRQISTLARGADILVATPGRLIDLMDRGAVDLGTVRELVLDEADQMLDMGFIQPLRRIVSALGTPRRTMLFSATMPPKMDELSRAFLHNPKRVEVTPRGRAVSRIAQSVQFMDKADKPAALRAVLHKTLAREPGALTLVFVRTKHGAEKLMKGLVADGYNAASIHGNKSQNQRDRAINAFRAGEVSILVATDVAARGIDVPGVALVMNYELPDTPANYVHRIGRTARAGRSGEAIAFCCGEEIDLLRDVEQAMNSEIPTSGTRPVRLPRPAQKPRSGPPQGRGGPARAQPKGKGGRQKQAPARSNAGRPAAKGDGASATKSRRPRRQNRRTGA